MSNNRFETLRNTVNSQPLGLALTTVIYEIRRDFNIIYRDLHVLRSRGVDSDEIINSLRLGVEDLREVVDELLVKIIAQRIDSIQASVQGEGRRHSKLPDADPATPA